MRSTNLKEQGMGEHNFGDYIVFVDESGDQSLKSVNANYPVFVLSFCIFEKTHYYTHVVPEILRFKFDFFGREPFLGFYIAINFVIQTTFQFRALPCQFLWIQ